MLKMSPNSQIHGSFMLVHKTFSTALNLGGSASYAMSIDIAVKYVGPPIPLPSGTVPKRFKSKHKPTSTLSKPTDVFPTGIYHMEELSLLGNHRVQRGKGLQIVEIQMILKQ